MEQPAKKKMFLSSTMLLSVPFTLVGGWMEGVIKALLTLPTHIFQPRGNLVKDQEVAGRQGWTRLFANFFLQFFDGILYHTFNQKASMGWHPAPISRLVVCGRLAYTCQEEKTHVAHA